MQLALVDINQELLADLDLELLADGFWNYHLIFRRNLHFDFLHYEPHQILSIKLE